MDLRILGERLRQIRLMLGLTQKELAAEICLDRLFAPDFIAAKEKLLYANKEDILQKMVRQLDLIADTISEANETSLAQINRLKKEVL